MSINAQPFNPTFKLTGNLQQDQVLVYDVSENAFVNTIGSGTGGAGTGVDSVTNTGTGLQLADLAGSSLTMKSILAGENISITDNGSSIVLSASFTESIQSGTNLGSGTGLFANVDTATNQLQFKSIRVVGDLQLADDGQTITISYSGPANVSLGTTNNLSDVDNIALARSNLGVLSKAEANAKYVRLDSNSLPTQNNLFDIGSASLRFNDIYAETLQGTAVLSDNLTIGGREGDVLTRIGGTWVARPASQAQIDLSDYATTTELNTAITNIVHPNIPADVSDLTDTTSLLGQGGTTLDGLSSDVNTNMLTIEAGWDLIPATDGLQSLGSPSNRYAEIYIDNSTINIGGNAIETDADNDGNLLWNNKIVATQEYVQSVLPTPFSGSYNDLTDKPTLSGGGAALAFVGIAVDGQTQVLADGNADTLTFEAGAGMTITTDSATDKITFASAAGVAGADTQIQYNNSGAFGAEAGFTYNASTNTLSVPNLVATNITATGAGTQTITAGTNIELDATNRVLVTDTPFRLASFNTAGRDAIAGPTNGDMIYNTTTTQIESYENSAWGVIGLKSPTFAVSAPDSSAYQFNGAGTTADNNPTLYLRKGETYIFDMNASGHPFYIQTSSGAYNSGNVYTDTITNSGAQSGIIAWTVQMDAPATLYYVCQYHAAMAGTINIS